MPSKKKENKNNMINKKIEKKTGTGITVLMVLVLGLSIFMAAGCTINLGEKKNDTASSNSSEASKNDSKTEQKPAEAPTPTATPAPPPPAPKKEQKVPPPENSTVGHCTGDGVVLRDAPSQEGRKIGSLKRGQILYIMDYSEGEDNIKGVEKAWVYVQTESGARGWVFGQYISNY